MAGAGGPLWNGRFEGTALHMGKGKGNYGAPQTHQRCAGCRAMAQSRDSPAGGGPGAGALLRSACRSRWARAMILARMRSPFRILSSCWGVYTGNGSLGESLQLGEFPRWPVCCRASLAVRPGRFFFLLASVISPVRGGLFRAAVSHWLYPAGPPAALRSRSPLQRGLVLRFIISYLFFASEWEPADRVPHQRV